MWFIASEAKFTVPVRTYLDRNEVLLIRLLPKDVAWRAVLTHQNAEWMTTTGGPATDRGRGPPDHLRVMPDRLGA